MNNKGGETRMPTTFKECRAATLGLWESDPECARLSAKWAKVVGRAGALIHEPRKLFHQWHPLRVYTSVTRMRGGAGRMTFSLRFKGQEVGELHVGKGGEVRLKVSAKQASDNAEYFKVLVGDRNAASDWSWARDKQAKQFRRLFADAYRSQSGERVPKQPEHQVESLILEEMQKTTKTNKFNGTLWGIQPILVAGCPFQFPLPIAASGGTPRRGNGNIDILARTGRASLAVWEIKKPHLGLGSKAHLQAYAYALTLAKMLREGESGRAWYRAMGFNSGLPSSLTIEAAAVFGNISPQWQDRIVQGFAEEIRSNSGELRLGRDRIQPRVVFYETDHEIDPRTVKIVKIASATK